MCKLKLNLSIIILSILVYSCGIDNKMNIENMKCSYSKSNNEILICESISKEEKQLTTDIKFVLNKLLEHKKNKQKQLLFYIDGTNGNIIVTGYQNESEKTFDDFGIWIELEDLLEENDNSFDFDEIVINSIINAFKTENGEILKKKHTIFYQTEIDNAIKIQ